jgi:hypothetical protein
LADFPDLLTGFEPLSALADASIVDLSQFRLTRTLLTYKRPDIVNREMSSAALLPPCLGKRALGARAEVAKKRDAKAAPFVDRRAKPGDHGGWASRAGHASKNAKRTQGRKSGFGPFQQLTSRRSRIAKRTQRALAAISASP